ncbi:unnamed protein product, partial [Symbiodinium microadriaticum]
MTVGRWAKVLTGRATRYWSCPSTSSSTPARAGRYQIKKGYEQLSANSGTHIVRMTVRRWAKVLTGRAFCHWSPSLFGKASVCRHAVLRHRTQIQDVSSHDLCPVHMGAQLPTYFLYIAKPLATAMVDFFTKRERGGQMLMVMPRYVSADPAIKPLPPDEVWSVENRAPRNPSAKGSFSHSDPLKWGFALSAKGEALDSRRPSRSTTKLAPLMP